MQLQRMKIKSLFIVIASFYTIHSYAQTLTQTVKGRVVDITTGAPIFGATISLIDAKEPYGSTTDSQGYFKLEKCSCWKKIIFM